MGYANRFEHDVFVSYAHLDNEPIKPGQEGWVSILVECLKAELSQRLGSGDLDVWMDYRLVGNEPLTDQLLNAAQNSATLLVVLSPAYLNSQWCKAERGRFLERMAQRKAAGTVFVAHALDVSQKPSELADLLGYSFWVANKEGVTQRIGAPEPRDDARFIERVAQMSYSIKQKLTGLREHQHAPEPRASHRAQAPTAPSVYIACSTDDLIDQEESLRGYLQQQGVNAVLGSSRSVVETAEFERQMREEIARCCLYVQLLSGSKGRVAPGGARVPVLQDRIAAATEVPRLLWRSRELDMSAISDDAHKRLLEQARACGLEEFKRAVVDATRPAKAEPKRKPITMDSPMVFVNAESSDHDLAKNIGHWLASQGIDCYWPLTSGTPERLRLDREENLLSCDGVLWVYGNADAGWVVAQLRHGRRVLSQRAHPAAIGIVEGPPPVKGELPAAIPDLEVLDCRDGLRPAVFGQFIERIRASQAEA